jgi:arsenate reductase
MKTNPREILVYYNPESSGDKKTIAHARGVSKHLRTFAFSKNPSTTTSWKQILNSLGMHPKELFNKAHPEYQKSIKGKEFNDEDWLDMLQRNPHLIKAPIAIRGNKAILCTNSTDIYRLI